MSISLVPVIARSKVDSLSTSKLYRVPVRGSRLRTVGQLFRREWREALRERSLIVYSLMLPLLLYPLMLWVVFTGRTFIEGQYERQQSRVVVVDMPTTMVKLHTSALEERENPDESSTLLGADDSESSKEEPPPVQAFVADTKLLFELMTGVGDIESARERLGKDDVDVVVVFRRPADAAEDFEYTAQVYFDGSNERSVLAERRVRHHLQAMKREMRRGIAVNGGVSTDQWRAFAIENRNEATQEDMGAFFLSLIVPLTIVIMVTIASIHPAVDTLAGEKERGTWETTMSLAVDRRDIVWAKYLYVSSMAWVGGTLNLVGITVTAAALLQQIPSLEIEFDWTALPVMMGGTAILALLYSSLVMIVAGFAQTFKEGQAFVAPIIMISIFAPMLANLLLDENVEIGWAAVPLVNVVVIFRDALLQVFRWDFMALSLLVSSLIIYLGVKLAQLQVTTQMEWGQGGEDIGFATRVRAFVRGVRKGMNE